MHEQAPVNHEPIEMLPPESNTQPEEEPVLTKIRIIYDGILSDRMQWDIGNLSTFEQISDLRSQITIVSQDTQETDSAVTMGDTMALRSNLDARVLFDRQSSPRQNVNVTTNFSSGHSIIAIDDKGLAKEMMKDGKAFDQEEFARRLDKLVKTGLREVIVKEKKLQIELALKHDLALSLELLSGIPALIYTFNNLLIDSSDLLDSIFNSSSHYEDVLTETIPTTILITSLLMLYIGGRLAGKSIIYLQDQKFERGELNKIYFEGSDRHNPINPIGDKQKTKRFLKNKNNTLVRLKETS